MVLHLEDKIKKSMFLKFKTIKDFSEATGIAYPSLREYLTGKTKPGYDALASIIKVTGVSADWLLIGKGEITGGSDHIDATKLTECIEKIETLALNMQKSLPPQKKAALVSTLYEACMTNQPIDHRMLEKMIELAAY